MSQMLLIGFRTAELDSNIALFLKEISPGGVILFDYDLPSDGQLPRNIRSVRGIAPRMST